MPCERKHVEAIDIAQNKIRSASTVSGLEGLHYAIDEALAACDESPTAAERVVERIREWGEQLITNYTHDDELNTIGATMLSIINEEEAK